MKSRLLCTLRRKVPMFGVTRSGPVGATFSVRWRLVRASLRDSGKAKLHARLVGEAPQREQLARANQLYAVFARLAEVS